MHAQVQEVIDDAVLSYHVYNSNDHTWLGEGSRPRFTRDYHEAMNFNTFDAADKAMQATQVAFPNDTLYVMACMPSTG